MHILCTEWFLLIKSYYLSKKDETEKPPKRSSQERQQITAAKIEDALIPCCKIESNTYVKGREKRKRKQRELRWFSYEDLRPQGKSL